jgi:hypothetical protein
LLDAEPTARERQLALEAKPEVMQRGRHLRQRRRGAAGAGGLVSVIALIAIAIAVVPRHPPTTVRTVGHGLSGPSAPGHKPGAATGAITVPDVVGQNRTKAVQSLTRVGLQGLLTAEVDPSVAVGTVIGQRPVAGSLLARGGEVTLVVSSAPTGPSSPSNTILLLGSGIDSVSFGTAQAAATTRLTDLLGPAQGSAQDRPNCNIDSALQFPSLTVYFYRGAFVGYSTLSDSGQRLSVANDATEKGLHVGDTLARAQQLYGSALTTTSAQGGAWFASTPAGRIDGYLTSEPNAPAGPAPKIGSIEAGSVGCPAMAP